MRPSNGARMVFFAMVARRFATVAIGLLGARLGGVEVGLRVGLAAPQPLARARG